MDQALYFQLRRIAEALERIADSLEVQGTSPLPKFPPAKETKDVR